MSSEGVSANKNLEIFRSLSGLDETSNKFLDFDRISPLARHYNLNLEDIQTETKQAKRMLEKKGKLCETIDEFAKFLNPLNLAFSELCKAVKIAMTLPVRECSLFIPGVGTEEKWVG